MPNNRTLYLARDDSGTFLFTTRPFFEKELGGPDDVGIWSESGDGRLMLQLNVADATDLLGYEPQNNCCYDVTVISTLIEKGDA